MASASASANSAAPVQQAPGQAALPVANRTLVTVAVMLATTMQILDTTIANVALPHMQTALGAQADTITWVLTSYIVASAIAMPVTGWLSDRIGSRKLFLIAVAGFVIASALCGAATSLTEIVLFRLLQGVCAAFMNPLSQTVLLDINPPENQARAMSIWSMGIMVGPILGPVLGGWLTENYDWRWVFYINLPVGIICLVMMWLLLPSRPIQRRSFDGFGFGLLALALASFQLLLDRGEGEDWFQSIEIWIEAAVAFSAFWMFSVHLMANKNAILNRRIFANRNYLTALFFLFIAGAVMFSSMALLPTMLQTLYGHSVFDTGLLMVPRGVGILLAMSVSGQLVQRGVDPRLIVGGGLALITLSGWQMTGWTLMMGDWPIIVSGMVQGLGMGMMFIPLQVMAFATLPPQLRTDGSSLLNLGRSIGSSVGISLATTVLARQTQVSHADMAGHVTAEQIGTLDPGMLQIVPQLNDAVLGMVNSEVTRQALMIAYLDDFRLVTIMTACAMPLVLLLKKPKGGVEIDTAAAAGH